MEKQGDEKAKNLKINLSTYQKRKETAGDVPFAGGTETLIHGIERSSTYWNGSCNSSHGEAELFNSLNSNRLGVTAFTHGSQNEDKCHGVYKRCVTWCSRDGLDDFMLCKVTDSKR